MCDCKQEYNKFPSVTIGGPPGDYVLPPPITSNDHVEFQVVGVASVGAPAGVVQISGIRELKALDTTGGSTYQGENPGTFIRAHVVPLPGNTYIPVVGPWEQVASPNAHIFIRIDGSTAAFVTIKQRVKILQKVPAPFVTNHPHEPQETHLERERRIRRAVWGEEGEAIEYGKEPVENERIRQTGGTGEPPYRAKTLFGPTRRGG